MTTRLTNAVIVLIVTAVLVGLLWLSSVGLYSMGLWPLGALLRILAWGIVLFGGYWAIRHLIGRAGGWYRQYALGREYLSRSDWEGAATWLRVTASEVPDNAAVRNDLGVALNAWAQVKWDEGSREEAEAMWLEAVASLQAAVRLKPRFPEALNSYGIALLKTGAVNEAVAALEKALMLQPGYQKAEENLAHAVAFRDRINNG